jgi:hypothetical protein
MHRKSQKTPYKMCRFDHPSRNETALLLNSIVLALLHINNPKVYTKQIGGVLLEVTYFPEILNYFAYCKEDMNENPLLFI